MEGRWLKINRKKTVYLRVIVDGNLDGNSDINIQGENLERMNTFKYLGATLAENGDLDTEMTINGMVKRLCKEEDVGYVDLWDSFVGKEENFNVLEGRSAP